MRNSKHSIYISGMHWTTNLIIIVMKSHRMHSCSTFTYTQFYELRIFRAQNCRHHHHNPCAHSAMPRRTPWPNRHEILFLFCLDYGTTALRILFATTSKAFYLTTKKKGKYAWNNARDAIKTKFSAFGDISGFEHYQNKKMEKERRADIRTAQSELCMHMFSTYAFFACTGRNAWTSDRAITDTKKGNGSMAKEAKSRPDSWYFTIQMNHNRSP